MLIPTLGEPVPVTSPTLPVLPTIEEVVLKSSGFGLNGAGSTTTDGSAQLIAELDVAALGIDLLTSSKALLTLETAQDSANTRSIGCAFGVSPDANLSNLTSVSHNYGTTNYPVYFTTATSLVLSREQDYPAGTTAISVFMIASTDLSYGLSTSNVMNYSFTLSSLA